MLVSEFGSFELIVCMNVSQHLLSLPVIQIDSVNYSRYHLSMLQYFLLSLMSLDFIFNLYTPYHEHLKTELKFDSVKQ